MVAAVCIGVVLRFINLDAAPLWFDETYTAGHMVIPWKGYLAAVMGDNQAPIYYASTKAWTMLVGLTPWTLRVPGLVASVACIPLVAASAEVIAGVRAAEAAAWLAAISPFLIQHAQDARPYALLAAFAVADLLVLLRFVAGRSSRLGLLWVLLSFAVVATHYYGIFFLAGQGLALLILRPRPIRSWLPAGLVAGALCGSLVMAAVLYASGAFAGEYTFGVSALPGVVWSMISGYTLMPTSEQLHALGPRAILPDLPIALVAVPAFAIVALAGIRALDARNRIVLVTSFGVALLAPFFYRLVSGAGVHPRYFAADIAPLLILMAIGMAEGTRRWPRVLSIMVLASIMLGATGLHLKNTGHGREDIYAAGEWLDANVPVDEEILVTSGEMEHLARFHWPSRRFRLFPNEETPVPSDAIASTVENLPFPGDRAIFMVGRAWLTDPTGALQTALVERYPACPGTEVPGIRIFCFQPGTANTIARATR